MSRSSLSLSKPVSSKPCLLKLSYLARLDSSILQETLLLKVDNRTGPTCEPQSGQPSNLVTSVLNSNSFKSPKATQSEFCEGKRNSRVHTTCWVIGRRLRGMAKERESQRVDSEVVLNPCELANQRIFCEKSSWTRISISRGTPPLKQPNDFRKILLPRAGFS